MRVLITGAAGFLGQHVVIRFLQQTNWHIVALDGITYAGQVNRLSSLDGFDPDRVTMVYHNLRSPLNDDVKAKIGEVDYIFHLAANSSVEYLMDRPEEAVMDNVMATVNVIKFAQSLPNLKLMNYFSTDEVYGPVDKPGDGFDEEAPHKPSNYYSAGKAGGEDFCNAAFVTHGTPIFISNTMNIIGFNQNKEKFIPTVIRKVLSGEELPVYSSLGGVAGSRFWIFANDVADALLFLHDKATPGEKYHIVGTWSDNLELAQKIAKKLGKPLNYKMFDFHSSRPGHDLHYGMKDTKMAPMGWQLVTGLDDGINLVVNKYLGKQ